MSVQWNAEHKDEMRAMRRDWYQRNKKHEKARIKKRRAKIRAWFIDYKATLACQECGENHPACLVFHHRDPNQKDTNISKAANQGWGKKRILVEVEKCDVLCANCHRKLHNATDYDAGAVQ